MAKSSTGTGDSKSGRKGRKLSAETKKKISESLKEFNKTGKTAYERRVSERRASRSEEKPNPRYDKNHPALKEFESKLSRLPSPVRDRLSRKMIMDYVREKRRATADARREAKMADGKRGSR